MCRHAAWLGAPRTLASLVHEPRHGLLRQSYAPLLQRHGTVNADGFGVGWYDGARAEPVRYRRAVPIWTDENLPGIARAARSGCLLASVRSATAGMPVEESATPPFADGPWLVSHNGRVAREVVRELADDAESTCDSAWLAAAVFARRRAGEPLGEALAEVVTRTGVKDPGARLNLLACDGVSVAATAWGDTLFVHLGDHPRDGVLVASEPLDGRPGWRAVPERTLVLASPDGVRIRPL
ncbi:ergothioneine biosynthesis protein EgtC [Streptosporangium longisporum]|uniref:Gamma-glutamyl-hercynylcysteine sulfoxide hydrolase n=1 Tax=Streptosporangium longisporum TaxID=46187 RepID=A0ABP6LJU3_9ACTN